MLQLLSHQVIFHPDFNHQRQVVDERRIGFGQRINSSITHDDICKLIHPKSVHSGIECRMALNIIVSVVLVCFPNYEMRQVFSCRRWI